MKHSTVFGIGLVLAVFLLSTSAMMQQDTANQLQDNSQIATLNAIQGAYISNNTWHKLILRAEDQATYNELIAKDAILNEINYGSFRMVVVKEEALGGRAALQALAGDVQDSLNLIALNGYTLDTTTPDA